MTIERLILFTSWLITFTTLYMLTPREKIRDAHVIFLFKQFITWPIGLLVAEFNLIKYPVREFQVAATSFTFEFLVYPAICVFFNLFYPENTSRLRELSHYIIYTTSITVVEVLIEKNTRLIDYITWEWYWTWITLFVTFAASRYYYKWFYKEKFHKEKPLKTSGD